MDMNNAIKNARMTEEPRKTSAGIVIRGSSEWTVWHDNGFRVFNSRRAALEYINGGEAW